MKVILLLVIVNVNTSKIDERPIGTFTSLYECNKIAARVRVPKEVFAYTYTQCKEQQ
jgi:hypothetical protein